MALVRLSPQPDGKVGWSGPLNCVRDSPKSPDGQNGSNPLETTAPVLSRTDRTKNPGSPVPHFGSPCGWIGRIRCTPSASRRTCHSTSDPCPARDSSTSNAPPTAAA